MDEEKKEQGRKCFIITPIGNENSDIFRKAKGVIESVIKPILKENGFDDIKPAYEIMESGMISNQIIDRIINDDLVVANLTRNNPNVMYELAIRHSIAKPIIHICENETMLPFDIKDNRTIFYTDDMLGVQELKNELKRFVKQVDYSKEYKDNPIYNAVKMGSLFKKMDDEGRQLEADILRKILYEISALKANKSNNSETFVDPFDGFYRIYMECSCTNELFIKFEENLFEKIRVIPDYDKNENIIGFYLYNMERENINTLYNIIYDIAKKCEIQNIHFHNEKSSRFTHKPILI